MKVLIGFGGHQFLANLTGKELELVMEFLAENHPVKTEQLDGKTVYVGQVHAEGGGPMPKFHLLDSVQLADQDAQMMCNKEYAARVAGEEWHGAGVGQIREIMESIFGSGEPIETDDRPTFN